MVFILISRFNQPRILMNSTVRVCLLNLVTTIKMSVNTFALGYVTTDNVIFEFCCKFVFTVSIFLLTFPGNSSDFGISWRIKWKSYWVKRVSYEISDHSRHGSVHKIILLSCICQHRVRAVLTTKEWNIGRVGFPMPGLT